MGEEVNKTKKTMSAIIVSTVRELINIVNEDKILKEDIVTVLPSKEGYIMIYFN